MRRKRVNKTKISQLDDNQMIYKMTYSSPFGDILLVADDIGLIGLYFYNQKNFARLLVNKTVIEKKTDIIEKTCRWLDEYFLKKIPVNRPPLHLIGTNFQKEVWNLLLEIPYGEVRTYKEITMLLNKRHNTNKKAYRAVASALSYNNILLVVPCHRVIGSNNRLGGYVAGTLKKKSLLELEDILLESFK